MQLEGPFYLHKLKEELSLRQRKNNKYSLRAYAKDLDIDSSNLSAILKNKRGLPISRAKLIGKRLKLSPSQYELFLLSANRKKTRLDTIKIREEEKQYLIDKKYNSVIADWEYYAFLQLLKTENFNSSLSSISKRLGISKARLNEVISTMIELNFIRKDEQKGFVRLSPQLQTSEDIDSTILQASHEEGLIMACEKLKEVPVDKRDFSSMTIAVDPKKMSQAKAIIREFQDKLEALMSDGELHEVYQFNCQLYPLTQKGNKK